jgi:glycosyltransferase involved in cell wall biosynthesis
MTALRYAVVTPARNERENLDRLARALRAQTLPPAAWVIVDDGSDDGTGEMAAELAATGDWIRVLHRKVDRDGLLAQGRREGRELESFRVGAGALSEPVDVVVKVDADTSFASNYFEQLIGRFAEQPDLGIASGVCHELEGDRWVQRTKTETSVWGASRAYRRDCVDTTDEVEACMGWDGLDEVNAHLRGYRTTTFNDLPFRHHRPEGGRERDRLRARSVQGRASWYMGYRPSYMLVRALYRARRDPWALAMLWGYLAAALSRAPRHPDERVVDALRQRQRLRLALRRGAPA